MQVKKIIFLFIAVLFMNSAKAIDASISYAVFKTPTAAYVELYFQILGSSTHFITLEDGTVQAKVAINVMIRDTLDEIIITDSLTIFSPVGDGAIPDFKHVVRYEIENGEYNIEVVIVDLEKIARKERSVFELKVDFNDNKVNQSMIQLFSACYPDSTESIFAKNGIYYEVLPYNFCSYVIDQVYVYNEIYLTDKYINTDFITHTWVHAKGKNKMLVEQFRRVKPANTAILLDLLDISELPSGNYVVEVEVMDRYKTIISNVQTTFQRQMKSNQELAITEAKSKDFIPVWVDTMSYTSLRYSLKALLPILQFFEVERLNNVLLSRETDLLKNFLFTYWTSRAPYNSSTAFMKYMKVARAVDKSFFSGFGYGFETDRGVIYLRYGQPDESISITQEPGAFPYEIWSYNRIARTGQTNVKFLFYNRALASNAYELLHSTAEGERNNERWERMLYSESASDSQPGNFIDATSSGDGIMRRAREYFNIY